MSLYLWLLINRELIFFIKSYTNFFSGDRSNDETMYL